MILRVIATAILPILAAASPCFEKHASYAARELPWSIDYIDGKMVVMKPAVVIGSLQDDLPKLDSLSRQNSGQIRLA